MWFWEVLWKDSIGNTHSLFCLEGYDTMAEAQEAFEDEYDIITKKLQELNAKLVVDEAIVYKDSDQLYNDGGVI